MEVERYRLGGKKNEKGGRVVRFVAGMVAGLTLGLAVAAHGNVGDYFVSVANYKDLSSSTAHWYAAGVYDTISKLAYVASTQGGLSTPNLVSAASCLDNHGEKVSTFGQWADSAIGGASSGSAAEVIISACIQK